MPDKTLICKDCQKEFVFTEGEQEFYKEKGLENEPQRCPECRKAKKSRYNRNRYQHNARQNLICLLKTVVISDNGFCFI